MSLQEIQNTSAPDGAAAGIVPAVAGAEEQTAQPQSISAHSTQTASTAGENGEYGFVTFDPGRKRLARVVAVEGEKVTVRRFDKKYGEWRTKNESRARDVCIPLSAAEAEESFPGSVAAWAKAAAGHRAKSTDAANSTQLEASCELVSVQEFSARIAGIKYEAPAFRSAREFKTAFEKAEAGAHHAARKKFDAEAELILHLAMVQSFLSERGANAHLRKQAGIKAGFEQWYEAFRKEYDVEYAFKTIQHKIAQLRGGCEHCGRLNEDHKKSCPRFKKIDLIEEAAKDAERNGRTGNGRSGKLDMREARNAYYADRYMAMASLLTNAPKDASPQQIFETMQQEATSAYEDLDADTAQKIKVPKLVKPKQSEIERAAIKLAKRIVERHAVLKATELRDEASRILAMAGITVTPEDVAPHDGQKKTEGDASRSTRHMQIAPIPQKPPEWMPLEPGKKYTSRPHPQGGWGIYEVDSTACWQKHPSRDAAWEAIEAVSAAGASPQQPSNPSAEVPLG